MSKLEEGIDYYLKSKDTKEKNYGEFLLIQCVEVAFEEIERLFIEAESQGKFLSIRYSSDEVDGGEYIIVDSLPD